MPDVYVEGVPCYWLLLQLPPISLGNDPLDLVVIGCGPAGLALAAESATLGLSVGLIGPDLPFTNNYGVWEDEFKGTSNLSKFKFSIVKCHHCNRVLHLQLGSQ